MADEPPFSGFGIRDFEEILLRPDDCFCFFLACFAMVPSSTPL